VRNPYVSDEIWNAVEPYFVPEFSPVKAALDTIFSKSRVLSSLKSMSKAGFNRLTHPSRKVIVATHPYLKGYLVKVFLDTMDNAEWHSWLRRARGARIIQDAINIHGYQHIMKVPKKWIYPLPADPSPRKDGIYRKNFVLLVQQMDILDDRKNWKAYKKKMTPEILNALYTLLTEYKLIDSVYADNVPFCKDGKMAFIDTEYTGDTTMDVPLSAVGQYLSKPMVAQWEQLIVNGL
jgi:hypothetical protein